MVFIKGAVNLQQQSALVAALATWTRLEALPLTADLAADLAAPVGDPLWLVARQWQSGELHGEDAGTPMRSEERRVGKECRSRWSPYH